MCFCIISNQSKLCETSKYVSFWLQPWFLTLLGIITKNIDIRTFDIAAMLTIYLKRDQDLYET